MSFSLAGKVPGTENFSLPSLASGGKTADAFNYLTSQESGLVNDRINMGGFIFDYAGEVTAELKSDITDHYTEDNTVMQDHAALNPIRITMRGLVGELVAGPGPGGLNGLLGGLQSSLTTINAYTGGKTPQAIVKASKAITQVQNVTNQISSVVSKYNSLKNFLDWGAESSTRQAKAYKQLETKWYMKEIMYIQTPFKNYPNMMIESLKMVQSEETKYVSEITVTLKQIRQAKVTVTKTGAAVVKAQKAAQVTRQGAGKNTVANTLYGPSLYSK